MIGIRTGVNSVLRQTTQTTKLIKTSLPKRPRNFNEGLRMAKAASEINCFLSGRTNKVNLSLLKDYNKNSVVDWITSQVIPSFQTWEPIKDNRDMDLLYMVSTHTETNQFDM